MARSAEYPDLPMVVPKAYGKGRDGKAVRFIVIHYTAGSERGDSAEAGAEFDQRRDDGTSTHYFVDQNSVIQCVLTTDRANAARHRGNRLGIQYELCGTVQTRAQWLDEASLATLRLAAKQAARDCKKYGIPVRRLSVAETRRAWTDFPFGPRGIVGHVDCTNAFPEDEGDHTDPGAEFPWDVFLELVRDEMEVDVSDWRQDDIDPSASTYTAGGAVWTMLNRTSVLNQLPGSIAELQRDLDQAVAEQDNALDGLAAAIVLTNAKLDEVLRRLPEPPNQG